MQERQLGTFSAPGSSALTPPQHRTQRKRQRRTRPLLRPAHVPRLFSPAKGEAGPGQRGRASGRSGAAAAAPRAASPRRSPQHAAPRPVRPALACRAPPHPIARSAATLRSRRPEAEAAGSGRGAESEERPGSESAATDRTPRSASLPPRRRAAMTSQHGPEGPFPCWSTTIMPTQKWRKLEIDSPLF